MESILVTFRRQEKGHETYILNMGQRVQWLGWKQDPWKYADEWEDWRKRKEAITASYAKMWD